MSNSEPSIASAPHEAGFTLLEMMMVLLLIGLLAGATLTIDFSGNKAEQKAAEAFVEQWQLAALESVQRGETWGLDFFVSESGNEQGYRWLRHDGKRWQGVDAALVHTEGEAVLLAEKQQIQVQIDAASLALENRQALVFASGASNTRFQPEVILQAAREVTPFSLKFCNADKGKCSETLQIDLLGRIGVSDANH